MPAPGLCGQVLVPAALALLLVGVALRIFEGGARPRPPAGEPSRDGQRRTPEEPRAAGPPWGPLPLGALYAVGALAFVLRRCLQGQDEAEVSPEEKPTEKDLLHREEQLAQKLAKTEQLLGGLLDQLDPLFERVDALAGAQQDLLTLRLHTISQLLKDKGLDTTTTSQEYNPPIHEDPSAEEDDGSDLQTWGWGEEPEERGTEAWAPHVSWDQFGENGKLWGLRRRKWITGIQVTD
ncbi:coiled-coil domain-containing protein 107 [Monodelphis domestica]|uniref:coiled-coil domain-containing protein 107 n=1 Tax=Monodelphis domestica TaxID=13616 RepID=UPI0024E2543B|nr:coiled-coil domain-containing protein 107 [Monodelphis domestica]